MAKMTAWRHHRHMTALMATFGRVLTFADAGKIFRLRKSDQEPFLRKIESAIELIDLNNSKFQKLPPADWATQW